MSLFREKIDISPIYIDMGWVPFFVLHLQMVMPAALQKQTLHKWSQVSSLDRFLDFKVTTSRNFWAGGSFSTCLSRWNNLCIIRIRCRLGFPLCLPIHSADTPLTLCHVKYVILVNAYLYETRVKLGTKCGPLCGVLSSSSLHPQTFQWGIVCRSFKLLIHY